MQNVHRLRLRLHWTFVFCVLWGACAKDAEEESGGGAEEPAASTCSLAESSWVPNITGNGASNHDLSVSISDTVLTASGELTGLGQAAPSSKEITVTFSVPADLGLNGSLSLVAETTQFPSDLEGNAYPLLVYLNDGTHDLVNLARAGTGGDCAQSGYFSCSGGSCSSVNSACTVQSPSAFASRRHWQQFQVPAFGYSSSNTFPTCNWSSGTPACAFNSDFFSSGKLKSGVTYTAKYVLLASSYSTLSGYSAGLKVTVIQKTDTSAVAASGNGAVDLNVILVGATNIAAGATTKGQTNLNELFNTVYSQFNQSGTGIKIGSVHAYDVSGCDSGEAFANVDLDSLETLFTELTPGLTTGISEAINVFIVSSIPYSGSGLTILGVSGAIGGPMLNGTGGSGLAFSSFNKLSTFNASCDGSSCPLSAQDADFVDMGETISHELGHFLGLNHPSESAGATHDSVPDTPQCAAGASGKVSHSSCLTGSCLANCAGYSSVLASYCPTAPECQFNHIMWYTTKNFSAASDTGDGNLFSSNSSAILNYNPFVH